MKPIPGPRALRFVVILGVLGAFFAAPGCGGDDDGEVVLEKAGGEDQIGETGRELAAPIVVRVHDADGNGVEGKTVEFSVTGGGGTVSDSSVVTGRDGRASVRWTMGAPPVWNRVRVSLGKETVEFTAWANPGTRPVPELVFQGPAGLSSEDLAFQTGRGLLLGTAGAILNIEAPGAGAVELDLTGEGIEAPVGIAFGPTGDVYVCENGDSGRSVKRVLPSGRCEILSPGFEGRSFALPNYIAVHSSGDLYLSSTCDDMIYRISPESGATTEFLSIPGPNGLAFDAGQAYLYVTSENPFVFCAPSPSIRGGLFRVPLGPNGEPGELEDLVTDFAMAGDGLAFDAEGNLYAVFSGAIRDRVGGFDDSGVFVYTPDGRFHDFFTVNVLEGDIITNVAFGVEPFDPTSLYCYGFSGKLYRVKVGIRGKALP